MGKRQGKPKGGANIPAVVDGAATRARLEAAAIRARWAASVDQVRVEACAREADEIAERMRAKTKAAGPWRMPAQVVSEGPEKKGFLAGSRQRLSSVVCTKASPAGQPPRSADV